MKGELPSLPPMELGMPCVAYLHSLLSWAIAVDMPCTSSNDSLGSRICTLGSVLCSAVLCCAQLDKTSFVATLACAKKRKVKLLCLFSHIS